jgi:hypothetical protein
VLGSIVLALAVLVAAVALTARQAAPPAIAEFAPQAVEQIKKTLDEQAPAVTPDVDRDGDGTADSPAPSPSAATAGPSAAAASPTAKPIEVPRVRQCVGSPPRQTEDPQSPPCVPYSDPKLDNGGATSLGVTRDQITVALPVQFLENKAIPPKLVDFFNKRYEFYGRKIVLRPFDTSGCADNVPAPDKQRADAIAVQEELQAFASLAYCGVSGGADRAYYDALADKKVLSIPDGNLITGTESAYAKHAPYQWNVQAGVNVILASTAQFVCAKLAGRAPQYAGGTQRSAAARKFGLISTRATDGSAPDLAPLEAGLRSCGVTLTKHEDVATSDPARNGVNAIVRMRDAGVTSLLCLCTGADTRGKYMQAATGQGYQPEWVLTSYGGNDLDVAFSGGNAPPDQNGHVIGLTFRNKLLPKQDMPWYWAVREADPTSDPEGNTYYASTSRYFQLLLLASGIQAAGPNLTPESFQRGLQSLRFPNPGAAGPPYFQARVGFEGRRHVMTVDAAMYWYDPNRPGTIDPTVPGSTCYVDRGRRYTLGEWTRSEPAFYTGSCL